MTTHLSRLALAPLHRPGVRLSGGVNVTERWTWDFVVDGWPLSAAVSGDVVGALGWGDAAWERSVVDRLLGRTPPDVMPNRVALYVCPECGDLGCGAVTAALAHEDDRVVWRDFRWERDWEGAPDDRALPFGPFRFARETYSRLLLAAVTVKPGAGAAPIAAG